MVDMCDVREQNATTTMTAATTTINNPIQIELCKMEPIVLFRNEAEPHISPHKTSIHRTDTHTHTRAQTMQTCTQETISSKRSVGFPV